MIRRATIVAVGKVRGWAAGGCENYLSRLGRYFRVEVIEVREEDINRRKPDEVLALEAERLLRRLPRGSYTIVLDRERGRELSSEELAGRLSSLGALGRSHVAFVVGGPLGLDERVLERADFVLSLGRLTLPHALARVVLLEQLYRAVKIERGELYHW
ncbi:23S rRNA (pseudouridine(1915)-N(3))-methyltransferase RlmH [Rubrobacter calidifluminis]|uniref:23S rRNA (pseudouridine(1915)-N(3))-methyltransferase RlmH n=1 Tax=Rubrobacter calidifluminis TaxID=1392640 RepID=UPI002362B816|nr:23S rRNA (pseudouridine(1915)-N(3))-methyltransferase RlmH [Rubrobacter calidifluminis]